MSYDLELCHPEGTLPKVSELGAVLRPFLHFRKNKTDAGSQFWYENRATGVYFSIDYVPLKAVKSGKPNPAQQPDALHPGIAFNMNLARPSFFADEAMPIVAAVATQLGLWVLDPQSAPEMKSLCPEPPDAKALIRRWKDNNKWAIAAARKAGANTAAMPTCTPRAARDWHEYQFHRAEIDRQLLSQGRDIFIPSLMLMVETQGQMRVRHAFVWPEGIPSVFPMADLILLGKDNGGDKELRAAKAVAVRRVVGRRLRQERLGGIRVDVLHRGCPKQQFNALFAPAPAYSPESYRWIRADEMLDV